MNSTPYTIIGNSAAALGAVGGIRSLDAEGGITIISKEPHHAYSRPLISYLLGGKVDADRMPLCSPDFYERKRVRLLAGTEAVALDASGRTIETPGGGSIPFEKLLIATGGKPIVPGGVDGLGAAGVFTFTTWDDATDIESFMAAQGVKRAVVLGGGLIGLKSVEALVARGVNTTVVELADRILSATFDSTASELACSRLEEAGVRVLRGTTVTRVTQEGEFIRGVTLKDGTALDCELLILAIGVVPNADIAADTPIEMDRGILVNKRMETSIHGIYAAGDVAQGPSLLGGERRAIPIFPNAYRQGIVAGVNVAGGTKSYEGGIAMNSVDILGLPSISVGLTDPKGDGYEVLSTLDADKPAYRKIVLRGDRIVGSIFIGDIDRAGIITGLIRNQVDVSGFRDILITDELGVLALPSDYRKHVVSGAGIEV